MNKLGYKIIGLLLLLNFTSAYASTVSLSVSDSFIEQGESFSIDVNAFDVNQMMGFGFNLDYDHSVLELKSVFVAADNDFSSGDFISGTFFLPLTGDYLLASLEFVANSIGSVDFGILSDILNPREGLIELDFLNGRDKLDNYEIHSLLHF